YRTSGSQIQGGAAGEDPGEWHWMANQPGDSDIVIIDDVLDEKYYDIHLRYFSNGSPVPGLAGDWYEENDYLVIGKSTPPAGVTGFSVSHNGNVGICQWNENTEIDLQGYIVRYMNYDLEFDFDN